MTRNRLIALKSTLAIATLVLLLAWMVAPEMSDLELPDFNMKGSPFSTTDSTIVLRRHQNYPAQSMVAVTDIRNGSTRYTRFIKCTPNEVGEYVTKTGTQIRLHAIDGNVIANRSMPSYLEPEELYGHMLVCTSVKGLSFVDLDSVDSEPYTESSLRSVNPRWNRLVLPLGSGRFFQTSYQNDAEKNFLLDVTNRKTTEFAELLYVQISQDGVLVSQYGSITLHSLSNGDVLKELSVPSGAALMPIVDYVYFGWSSSNRNVSGVNHFEGKPVDYIRVAEDIEKDRILRRLYNLKTNTYLQTDADIKRLHDVHQTTGQVLLESMDDRIEVVDPQSSTIVKLPWNPKIIHASFVGQDRIAIVSNDLLWQYNITVYDLEGSLIRTIRPLLFWRLGSVLLVVLVIPLLSIALRTTSRWHGFAWVDVLGLLALFFLTARCRNYCLQGTVLDWPRVLGAECSIAVLVAFWVAFGRNRFSIKFLVVQLISVAIVVFLVDTQLDIYRLASSRFALPFVTFWLSLGLFILMRLIGFTSRFRVGEVTHVAAGRFQIFDLLLITTSTALVLFSLRHGSFSWRPLLSEILTDRTALGALVAGSVGLLTGMTRWPLWVRITLGIFGFCGSVGCVPLFGYTAWEVQRIPAMIMMYGTISILTHLLFYAYHCRGHELGFKLGFRRSLPVLAPTLE